jgi:prepilin signal peptidase PulO-like enzyme (type II secretory pathway)
MDYIKLVGTYEDRIKCPICLKEYRWLRAYPVQEVGMWRVICSKCRGKQ